MASRKEPTLWVRPKGLGSQWLVLGEDDNSFSALVEGVEDGTEYEAKIVMMTRAAREKLGEHEGF